MEQQQHPSDVREHWTALSFCHHLSRISMGNSGLLVWNQLENGPTAGYKGAKVFLKYFL